MDGKRDNRWQEEAGWGQTLACAVLNAEAAGRSGYIRLIDEDLLAKSRR